MKKCENHREYAHAKINLGLWVGPKALDGYHPIDSVMHTIALGDVLTIESAPQFDVVTSGAEDIEAKTNLVAKAYDWLRLQGVRVPSIRVHLEKHIPIGAGLGGGSSDAAAILRWGARIESFDPDRASQVGMDVPFFLRGGAARVGGYGERITSLPDRHGEPVLLINPGFEVSTEMVYGMYDLIDNQEDCGMDEFALAWSQGEKVDVWPNALEPAAWLAYPSLRDFKEYAGRWLDGMPCHLSGSGGTYYCLGLDPEQAIWYRDRLRKEGIPWAEATHLVGIPNE